MSTITKETLMLASCIDLIDALMEDTANGSDISFRYGRIVICHEDWVSILVAAKQKLQEAGA